MLKTAAALTQIAAAARFLAGGEYPVPIVDGDGGALEEGEVESELVVSARNAESADSTAAAYLTPHAMCSESTAAGATKLVVETIQCLSKVLR